MGQTIMSFATQMTDEDVYRARILNDDKVPRRLIKKFHSLANNRPENGDDIELSELEALHASFITDLTTFYLTLTQKHTHSTANSAIDAQSYLASLETTSQSQLATRDNISALTDTLAQAQRTRANKLEYDSLAAKINELASREKQNETIARLGKEIEELGQEATSFRTVWQRRKEGFDGIVSVLEEIGRDVSQEKSEQERRQAMDQDEEPDQHTAQASKEGSVAPESRERSEGQEDEEVQEMITKDLKKQLDPSADSFEAKKESSRRGMDIDEVEDGEVADSQ